MAWIESHQSLYKHPKTARLMRRLGISRPAAIGHLHILWWWALDHAPDGNLSAYSDEDIADAADWAGDATAFVAALVEAGFIDVADDGRRSLHDWLDYAGTYLDYTREREERRRQEAEKKRRQREVLRQATAAARAGQPADSPRPPAGQAGDERGTNTGRTGDEHGTRAGRTGDEHLSPPIPPSLIDQDQDLDLDQSSTREGGDYDQDLDPTHPAAGASLVFVGRTRPPGGLSRVNGQASTEPSLSPTAYYEQAVGVPLNPKQVEDLDKVAAKLGPAVVIRGIESLVESIRDGSVKGPVFPYLLGILRNWQALRLTTIDAVEAHEAARRAAKAAAANRPGKRRHDDKTELDKLLEEEGIDPWKPIAKSV